MNDRYFTERLFWMSGSNTLLHVSFMHGHGWAAQEETQMGFWTYPYIEKTYAEVMSNYSHRSPELLLQEEG